MRNDIVDLISDLVAIESVNPSLVPGGAGEGKIAAFVTDWAGAAGLEATTHHTTDGRPSVVVRAPGSGGGRALLLCAHLDTVSAEGAGIVPQVDGDRLRGRGSYDMKAGLAAALLACRAAAERGLAGDVVVAAVADEEHASLGIQEVLRTLTADAAIVTEPTELEVAIAHKGFVWAEIEVTGRAAHGSRPHLGVDAILKMGPILSALAALEHTTHPLLGDGSLHASLIEGGEELSSYPARCVLKLERRTLPGETAEDFERELDAVLDGCRAADPELVVQSRIVLAREPFELDPEHELVALATDVIGTRPGGVSYWADSAFIAAAGIPTILLGPVGAGAHADEEWVSISSTETLTRALIEIAARVSGPPAAPRT